MTAVAAAAVILVVAIGGYLLLVKSGVATILVGVVRALIILVVSVI